MVAYISSVTDTHGVHASSFHLYNLLRQGHERRLLPLHDVFTLTQLSHVTLAQNKNLAWFLTMTLVGNYYGETMLYVY